MVECWTQYLLHLNFVVPIVTAQFVLIIASEMLYIWLSRRGLASHILVVLPFHRLLVFLLGIVTILNFGVFALGSKVDLFDVVQFDSKILVLEAGTGIAPTTYRVVWVTANSIFHSMTVSYLAMPSGGKDAEKFAKKMAFLLGFPSFVCAVMVGVVQSWLPVVVVQLVLLLFVLGAFLSSFTGQSGRVMATRLQAPWSMYCIMALMAWYTGHVFRIHMAVRCNAVGVLLVVGLIGPFIQVAIFQVDAGYWKRLVRTRGFQHQSTRMMMMPLIGQMFPSAMVRDWYGYAMLGVIGQGSQAIVHRVRYKRNPEHQAMKQYEAETLGPDVIANFLSESLLLYQIEPHPNVLKLEGVCICPPRLCIVTELCSMSLFAFLRQREKLNQPLSRFEILSIGLDVSLGMQHLHRQVPCVIHRDLKSLNVLLTISRDGKVVAKVADMGCSRLFDVQERRRTESGTSAPEQSMNTVLLNTFRATRYLTRWSSRMSLRRSRLPSSLSRVMTGNLGTVPWCAPEVLRNEIYDHKCDVFSMAVVLWEVVTGKEPGHVFPSECMEGFRLSLEHVPGYLAPLITQCWSEVPSARPSFDHITHTLTHLLEHTQTPNAQTPNAQTPNAQTPNAQTPNAQTPKSQTPNAQTPNAQTPNAQTPAPATVVGDGVLPGSVGVGVVGVGVELPSFPEQIGSSTAPTPAHALTSPALMPSTASSPATNISHSDLECFTSESHHQQPPRSQKDSRFMFRRPISKSASIPSPSPTRTRTRTAASATNTTPASNAPTPMNSIL